MVLNYKELNKLNIDLNIKDLKDRFFQLGHEVEELIDLNIDNLVIGEIISLEKHPDADKLNICKVNVGSDILQIVCGAPNVRQGQKVIVALEGAKVGGLEIKPVKIKGIESRGMICSLAELGFDSKFLQNEDIEGIHEILEEVHVGENAMEALNINDIQMDIFLTANRGDCQSYRGLYNDLSALLNYSLGENKYAKYEVPNKINYDETIDNTYDLEVENGSDYFTYKLIKNVNIMDSSWEKKLFLLKHNFKSQNNVTDISNINLIKYGIPSHIYDADTIEGKIVIKKLEKEETFIGLDEKEIMLPKNTLVIKDSKKIICVAGVMGSYDTRVTSNTKNILVEVASFSSSDVFFSSKVIGKKTEAALRYEKKVDLAIVDNVMNIICNDIAEVNDDLVFSNTIKIGNSEYKNPKVVLKYNNVKNILGIDVSHENIVTILKNLEFNLLEINEGLEAIPPSYRNDIYGENDLIEEIIRIYNIDNIEIDDYINSFANIDKVIKNNNYIILRYLENFLLKEKLNQVITYSLVGEKEANEFVSVKDKSVKLMHPLSKEHEYYRQSLVPSLIKIAKDNYAYQENSNEIFEISKTYSIENDKISEQNKLAILVSGDYEQYYMGAKRKYNFYDLKNKIENLFSYFKIDSSFKKIDHICELNPYAQASIVVNEKAIGFIGEVVFDYDKKIKEKLFVLELDLYEIIKILDENKVNKYENISFLPKITRDLTLKVQQGETYDNVVKVFENISHLQEFLLLDIYSGTDQDDHEKSMTFRLSFQNFSETLTGEEIDIEMEKIFLSSAKKGYLISGK